MLYSGTPNPKWARIDQYREGGKSVCACGHRGDGPGSQHHNLIGHGACLVEGCPCEKFTWDHWYADDVPADAVANGGDHAH